MRPSFDETAMEVARTFAARSTCPRAAVGAVITRDKRIVSTGYNGAPPGMDHCEDVGCDPQDGCRRTIHAEANAVAWAARHGISTDGATMYSTYSPCVACAYLVVSAGIVQFVYDTAYRDHAGIEHLRVMGVLAQSL